jgi:hypothetical protein
MERWCGNLEYDFNKTLHFERRINEGLRTGNKVMAGILILARCCENNNLENKHDGKI